MILKTVLNEFDPKAYLENGGNTSTLTFLNGLKNRVISLIDDVCIDSVEPLIDRIMEFNRQDSGIPVEERKPILLYVCSDGGECDTGFALIDTIMASKTPVYTIATGYAFSMACIIFMSGHKRFALKHSSFLIHDGLFQSNGPLNKVADDTAFANTLTDHMHVIIFTKTQITKREMTRRKRAEWYLTADEAKKRGIVDQIVGVDCTLDEII